MEERMQGRERFCHNSETSFIRVLSSCKYFKNFIPFRQVIQRMLYYFLNKDKVMKLKENKKKTSLFNPRGNIRI